MEQTLSDKIGITASILCLIHCLALPIIFTLFAETLHLAEHEMPIIDYIFAFVALLAAVLSAKKNTNIRVKIAFAVGWTLFIIGVLFHENPYLFITLHIGSVILIITHLKNIRSCRIKHKNNESQK